MLEAAPQDGLRGLGIFLETSSATSSGRRAAALALGSSTAGDGRPGRLGVDDLSQQDPSRQILRSVHRDSWLLAKG